MSLIIDILKSIAILGLFVWLIQILMDILKSTFTKIYFKWVWMALVTFLPVVGLVVYYFYGGRSKLPKQTGEN
jgi:hypothetical protein